mmetsp:Transcript_37712/g.119071  ORF Transcript_37712/g.119071 Transcript_37712/m.119071 type:complete len:228 (+) Transcript_37712:119-802(+)
MWPPHICHPIYATPYKPPRIRHPMWRPRAACERSWALLKGGLGAGSSQHQMGSATLAAQGALSPKAQSRGSGERAEIRCCFGRCFDSVFIENSLRTQCLPEKMLSKHHAKLSFFDLNKEGNKPYLRRPSPFPQPVLPNPDYRQAVLRGRGRLAPQLPRGSRRGAGGGLQRDGLEPSGPHHVLCRQPRPVGPVPFSHPTSCTMSTAPPGRSRSLLPSNIMYYVDSTAR